ncbi:doubled CXXCH domain-containing protein [Ruegeria intermedia]|uniref:Doubled CXXCH domain-containing protein n=1 Tax=Ruegeria intermedia TaxID=996115 RepID=A0A1M4T8Q6_9RHOB|nr:multiheme c-type cytochrome [Ruegeria intermedia]SHE40718.1 doubled CXXCH domain-containing protein [Ruegeria intermedia]
MTIWPHAAWVIAVSFACILLAGPTAAQDYVGSEACRDCHDEQVQAWAGSHHAKAWTAPTPENVVADFGGATFAGNGMAVEFRRENGAYLADVTEQDGQMRTYRVHSVVGIEPLQQYLFETEPGRLQSFDVVWDTEEKRWFHLYPDQDLPPDDGLHWTGPYKTWNGRCAECHATGFKKNYDVRTQSYASTQSEIGVGCESCHGPGSAHLDWTRGQAVPAGLGAFGFSMQWGRGDTESEIQQCAGCHSRREAFADGNPLPGTPFHDAYNLAILRPGLYQPDGQIMDEVYVYGSFLQSKMYAKGVGCLNCHEAHGATLKAEGNAVCTQCHSPAGNPDFPTLRKALYDGPAHHRHTPGGEGAQCKSCHMIERVYMGVDGRRDHSFRVPRPDLGLGADACTDCHSDRDQPWAAAAIDAWHPDPAHRRPHFGTVFAPVFSGQGADPGALTAIALDADQPGIVRATAAYLLQPHGSAELAAATAGLLADADPLVRANVVPLQRSADLPDRIDRLAPLLSDPARSVRLSAAKEFLTVPGQTLTPLQRSNAREAMADWQRTLSNRLDFPETHLVLGGMALTLRNAPAAERAFRRVVTLDPQREEAWPMLVQLAQINRGVEAARAVLREGLKVLPDSAALGALADQLGR